MIVSARGPAIYAPEVDDDLPAVYRRRQILLRYAGQVCSGVALGAVLGGSQRATGERFGSV